MADPFGYSAGARRQTSAFQHAKPAGSSFGAAIYLWRKLMADTAYREQIRKAQQKGVPLGQQDRWARAHMKRR